MRPIDATGRYPNEIDSVTTSLGAVIVSHQVTIGGDLRVVGYLQWTPHGRRPSDQCRPEPATIRWRGSYRAHSGSSQVGEHTEEILTRSRL